MRRLFYLGLLLAVPIGTAAALLREWTRLDAILNGTWPPWVSNVANVVQIGGPIVALAWWLSRVARARSTEPGSGASARLLGLLALLLPAPDRERFVGEVLGNMASLRWRERVGELVLVAAAVPGLALIVRWARRRRG